LASIVLVSLSGAREKARDAKRESDIRQISLAMEMYYDEYTQYPEITVATDGTRITNASTPTPNYLDPWPTDPGGGSDPCNNSSSAPYCGFNNNGAQNEYCVFAVLESPSGDNIFAASEKGTSERATVTAATCW
jgi:type II secretory pathway pseudopilin PulG